jgi:hypothetical protein
VKRLRRLLQPFVLRLIAVEAIAPPGSAVATTGYAAGPPAYLHYSVPTLIPRP